MIKRHMRCAVNPAVGDERFIHLQPAETPRKLAVVGGGPGGMEAARIAALRGHQATIFERTGELGGAILYCCMLPGKNKMRGYADWLRRQVAKLGVEVRFHSSPSAEELRQFDAVILATGGKVARPAIPGIDSSRVCTFEDVLRCEVEGCEYYPTDRQPPIECGPTVLIWGDHFAAADSAEKLAADGRKVYVVTENREFAQWIEPCHRDVMLKRFAGSNAEGLTGKPFQHTVTLIPNTTVVEIAANEVTLMDHRFRKSALTVDNVVLASVAPEDSLYDQLLEAGIPVVKIGDLKRVRNLLSAVREGANAALTIDAGLTLNANRALTSRHPTEVKLGG